MDLMEILTLGCLNKIGLVVAFIFAACIMLFVAAFLAALGFPLVLALVVATGLVLWSRR